MHQLRPPHSQRNFEQSLRSAIAEHFQAAHARVPEVYKRHFASPSVILKRHWMNKKDIPQDLIAVPRVVIQQSVGRLRKQKSTQRSLSGKEQTVLAIFQNELLDLPGLEEKVRRIAVAHIPELSNLEALSDIHWTSRELDEIEAFISRRLDSYMLPREGSRDLMLFLLVGIIGKTTGHKVTFGSAIATGAAIAQSAYISHQGFWAGLWIHWTGTPAWVSAAGAVGGLSAAMLLAPLLSPLAETMVNRIRGEKHLHRIISQLEETNRESKMDKYDMAGLFASYAQLAPDLLQLLRSLRH